MMRNKTNNNHIQNSVAWTSAEKFYDIIQELHLDMLECRKQRDVWSMLDTLNDLYILVYPYIEKHMKPEEKHSLENFSDVQDCMGQYSGDTTDFAQLNTNKYIVDAIDKVNAKRLILSKLMAKAELNIPLKAIQHDRPAALSGDDW